jgi:hypothetical protein
VANPEHVEIVKRGAKAIQKWRDEHLGEHLELSGADLMQTNLQGADLSHANLRRALLHEANLQDANLYRANLQKAYLRRINLSKAILIDVKGTERAFDLDRARLDEGDALDFDECQRPWPERWLDWEHLRTVGRLPLFGVSYTVLILIPIFFYGLAFYNDKVDSMRHWAEALGTTDDHPLRQVGTLILATLHRQPIPSLSFWLLMSTVLLAIGSTIFTLRCPSRIREFSREEWCDRLRRPLLHYWPLSWKYRWWRLPCAICYTLGGALALWVIGNKVWSVAVFIIENSMFPWPWL